LDPEEQLIITRATQKPHHTRPPSRERALDLGLDEVEAVIPLKAEGCGGRVTGNEHHLVVSAFEADPTADGQAGGHTAVVDLQRVIGLPEPHLEGGSNGGANDLGHAEFDFIGCRATADGVVHDHVASCGDEIEADQLGRGRNLIDACRGTVWYARLPADRRCNGNANW